MKRHRDGGFVGETGFWEGLFWWLRVGKKKFHEAREDLKQVQLIAVDTLKTLKGIRDRLDGMSKLLTPPTPVEPETVRRDINNIQFSLNHRTVKLYGGPYLKIPEGISGVKMAAEIDVECDIDIPTNDFDVPASSFMEVGVIDGFIILYTKGELYVGCMGGIGRTGLFMAVMLKTYSIYLDGSEPVAWGDTDTQVIIEILREKVHPHAVETQKQRDYITDFDVEFIIDRLTTLGIFS